MSGPSARQQTTYGANLDRARYLRVVWFLGRVFLHVLWWDYLLRKIFPDSWPARTAESRWRRLSRRYRVLAVDMGGVLIKLGQFLSIRVDILPRAITDELIGLQDEVPAERLADVLAVIEEEFQQPANTIFDELEGVPLGAASLAQVHRARLPGDEEVVVKVQRPRIRVLVETDLASVRFGLRFLKLFRGVTRRADLDRLFAEFATITRAELDFEAEGRNAERFAANFAADRGVYVPKVHWDFTRPRVLTMENVSGIKITDFRAIDAAGVSRPQLAAKLYNVYLRQVFVLNFIHADPHPGNLFVHTQPPRQVEDGSGDAFRLVFVDFGMMAVVPERIRRHLREYIIGFGTRDSARVVRAYAGAGILLPGADLKRIEQAQSEVFSRFWGVRMGEIQKIAFSEARQFAYEYRDLIHEMPFQVPADMLFVGRALGILSGLATELDPAFDIWTATIPFAQQLAAEEETQGQLRAILAELGRLVRPLLTLPGQIERFLGQVTAGELRLQYSLAPDASKAIQRLEAAIARLTWGVIFGGTLLAGVLLRALEGPSALSSGLFIAAGLALLLGLTLR